MWQISFCLLLFAGFAQAPAEAQKAVPAASMASEFPIDSITVEGNRILPAAGIAAASGLKIGVKVNGAAFEAARDRLLGTGYFETAGFKFRPSANGGYDVTFEVREMQPLYSLRVEALPATAAEVTRYLNAKDPLFTGRLPGTEQVIKRTSREIEDYLASKGHPQKVAGKVVALAPQKYEVQFTPSRGLPNVALVSFEGNKAVRDTDLQNAIAAVAFGQPFTESNFRVLLDNQIRPLYEKSGYMKVEFPKIAAAPSTRVSGVDVHVNLVEGERYKMGAVTVRGSMSEESKHILRLAKVPQMTTADFDQIRQAAVRVQNGLRHEGYLDAEVSVDRELHDDRKTVDAVLIPQPGPQYTFGKLEIKGLGLEGLNAIQKSWAVKPGDPFPGEYPDYFLKRIKEDGLFDNLGDTRSENDVNAETHVVNVTLYFRYESDRTRKKKPADDSQPQQQYPQYPPYPGGPI